MGRHVGGRIWVTNDRIIADTGYHRVGISPPAHQADLPRHHSLRPPVFSDMEVVTTCGASTSRPSWHPQVNDPQPAPTLRRRSVSACSLAANSRAHLGMLGGLLPERPTLRPTLLDAQEQIRSAQVRIATREPLFSNPRWIPTTAVLP